MGGHDDEHSWIMRVAGLEREIFRLDSSKNKYMIAIELLTLKPLFLPFEEDLALYIYPRGRRFGHDDIFPKLKMWLVDKGNTPQGIRANEKWSLVKREVTWNEDHEKLLKRFRKPEYVPTTADAIEVWNPDPLTEDDRKCIKDIRHLSKTLTEWIEAEESEIENQ